MRCEILATARRFNKDVPDCEEVCLETFDCPPLKHIQFSPISTKPKEPEKKEYNVPVTGCEHHKEYTQFLTDKIAVELLDGKSQDGRSFGQVWGVVNNIAICKSIKNITSEEAESLNLIVFKLYPQYEEQLKAELAEHFG